MKPTTSSATAAITRKTGFVRRPIALLNPLNNFELSLKALKATFTLLIHIITEPIIKINGPIAATIKPIATTNF